MWSADFQHRGAVGLLLVASLVAALLLPGCSSHDRSQADADAGTVVRVVERDFEIRLSKSHVHAGTVTLQVVNEGPAAHELIVVRSTGRPLPLRKDDVTIDEDKIEDITVGALEPGRSGAKRTLPLQLKPGMYSVVCNMSGHFMGGMYADLKVTK